MSAMTGLAAALKKRPRPLNLLWRFLATYEGLNWTWLAGVALSAALGVNLTVIGLPDERVAALALAALILSGGIIRAGVRIWLAAAAIPAVGAAYLLLGWANLWRSVQSIAGALAAVAGQLASGGGAMLPAAALQQSLVEGHQRLLLVAARLAGLVPQAGAASNPEPLAVQLVWGMALWLAIGLLSWLAWTRQQAVMAVLPPGALLVLSVFFTGRGFGYVLAFLGFTLLLQAGLQGWARQIAWQKHSVDFAGDLFADLTATVIPIAGIIIGLTYSAPTVSGAAIADAVYDALNLDPGRVNQLALTMGLNPVPNPAQAAGLQGLPRSHLLGNPPDLDKRLVMTVKTGEFPPITASAAAGLTIPRYYWLSIIYSRYNSWGWTFAADLPVDVAAGDALAVPQGRGKRLTQFVRRGPFANKLLHTGGVPLSANRRVEASYTRGGDLLAATLPDSSYTVESWLAVNSPDALRAAAADYPDAIRQTYLGLPASVPGRVRQLARNLTATQPTPFDKALAIEDYLRSFPYSLNVPQPPPGADVADYFLFELRQGYCDYYATAMVVLARAAGLPARFVVGYAPGDYNPLQAEYRITEAEAHSWPQIYFAGAGWVDFEPTAGRAPLDRNADAAAGTEFAGPVNRLPEPASAGGASAPAMRVHPFWWAVLVAGGGYLAVQLQQRRLRRLPPRALGQLLYGQLLKSAERAGFVPPPGHTPFEFARRFTRYLEQHLAQIPFQPLRGTHFAGVSALAEAFVRQQYAPLSQQTAAGQARSMLRLWQRTRPRLWQAALILRVARLYATLFNRATPPSNPTSSPSETGTMGHRSQ